MKKELVKSSGPQSQSGIRYGICLLSLSVLSITVCSRRTYDHHEGCPSNIVLVRIVLKLFCICLFVPNLFQMHNVLNQGKLYTMPIGFIYNSNYHSRFPMVN